MPSDSCATITRMRSQRKVTSGLTSTRNKTNMDVLEQLTLSPRLRFSDHCVDRALYGHAIMLTLFGNMHRTSMWRCAEIVTPAEWRAHVQQTLLGMRAASEAAESAYKRRCKSTSAARRDSRSAIFDSASRKPAFTAALGC